ncbi:MAG: metal-dependent hydrolase [Oceanospirillum sp.]|nr:metal-dependent hydrolase [Oceanospirillum sp.]|tara:strand:+ start:2490 stop:2861 length:372 start_codon:yes stop_codon:yes gene_type:complete
MSSGKTHIVVGAATGLVVSLIDRERQSFSHNPCIATVLGALFGKFPDIPEPALHPHHRQFFHSKVVFAATTLGLIEAYKWKPDSEIEKIIRGLLLICGGAYLSHLICDSTTPRGLPLLGKLKG